MQHQTYTVPSPATPIQEGKKSLGKLGLILLWFLTSIVFAGLGAGGYWLLTKEKKEEEKTDTQRQSCTYNNQTYNDGDHIKSTDECNTCICEDGTVYCTEMECVSEPGIDEDKKEEDKKDTSKSTEEKKLTPEEECEQAGGIWGIYGNDPEATEQCSYPTSDAGKSCTDSSQCEAFCEAPDGAKPGDTVTGKCYGYTLYLCAQEVENGKALPAWCI